MTRSIIRSGSIAAAVAIGACSDSTSPGARKEAVLFVSADVTVTPVSTIVIAVTAADITKPLAFNLQIQNGTAASAAPFASLS